MWWGVLFSTIFFPSEFLESFDPLVCAKCSVDTLSVEVSQPFPKPPPQPQGELTLHFFPIPSSMAFIALHCSHYLFIFVSPTRLWVFPLQSLCLLQVCILSSQLMVRTPEIYDFHGTHLTSKACPRFLNRKRYGYWSSCLPDSPDCFCSVHLLWESKLAGRWGWLREGGVRGRWRRAVARCS